jgi:cytidylate kinase
MLEVARGGEVILEGRLAGFFAGEHDLPALKVWLTASEGVRARRVAKRESGDSQQLLKDNRQRQQSDAKRYKEIYGFDLNDTSIYDLVVSSDDKTPEALASYLAGEARRYFDGPGSKT